MKKIVFIWWLLIAAGFFTACFSAEEIIRHGQVLAVNKKFNFVIINLGEEDGVRPGMIFFIHRNKKFIGRIETEEVYPKMSSCIIESKSGPVRIKVDDGVIEE